MIQVLGLRIMWAKLSIPVSISVPVCVSISVFINVYIHIYIYTQANPKPSIIYS